MILNPHLNPYSISSFQSLLSPINLTAIQIPQESVALLKMMTTTLPRSKEMFLIKNDYVELLEAIFFFFYEVFPARGV